jgi:ethanolamine utilization protein EutP
MHVMVVGAVGCGKTTLCQCLAGLPRVYVKTQTVGFVGSAIDTPGEYVENRLLRTRLSVIGTDASLIFFLQDATNRGFYFSVGQAAMFGAPVVGVVTKVDQASPVDLAQSRELLTLAGATPIFEVSALAGAGIEALMGYMEDLEVRQGH